MVELQEQLKYFVHKKLATDPAWQKVKVILSGHCVSPLLQYMHIQVFYRSVEKLYIVNVYTQNTLYEWVVHVAPCWQDGQQYFIKGLW